MEPSHFSRCWPGPNETQPILDASQNHKDEEVRLCADSRVERGPLSLTGAKAARSWQAIRTCPKFRTAMSEVLYKLDSGPASFRPSPK